MFMKAKSFNLQLYMHNNEIAGVSARIFFYLFQGPFSVMIFDDCHFFNSFRFGIKFAIENTNIIKLNYYKEVHNYLPNFEFSKWLWFVSEAKKFTRTFERRLWIIWADHAAYPTIFLQNRFCWARRLRKWFRKGKKLGGKFQLTLSFQIWKTDVG